MSLAVYQETEKAIDNAYKQKNKPKIEKETSYIFNLLVTTISSIFNDRIRSIHFDTQDLHFDEEFIASKKNQEALLNWLDKLNTMDGPLDNYGFGKLKVDFEEWFYQIGGEDITFDYHLSYLLTPKEVQEKLGISNVTLANYVKQGLEYINHSSHHRIPKHMIPLWKDPVYAIKVQMLHQQKKLRNQEPETRLKEVMGELLEFQIKYKAETIKDAFPIVDGNNMDSLSDYYEWESLEEEYKELKQKIYRERKDGK